MFTALRNRVVVLTLLGAVLAAGAAGWHVNGWRLRSEAAQREQRAAREFRRQLDKELADWKEKSARLESESQQLSTALALTRTYYEALSEEIANAELLPAPGTCPVRNPFSDEFVRLWNAPAQRGEPARPRPGAAATPR